MDIDSLITEIIQEAIVSRILIARPEHVYFTPPPVGGYVISEEYEYVIPGNNDVSSMIFLDIATRFGSPGTENPLDELYKRERRNQIKKIGNSKKIKTTDPEINCSICLDDLCIGEYQKTLGCEHTFHKKCIDKWLRKGKNNCPICRNELI